jgi:diguanylate cyclase
VDAVKLDRSFCVDLDRSPADEAIVAAAIELSHKLGYVVVAEGVETEGALVRLRELGCDVVQGYLVSRPMPGDEALAWLETHRDGYPVPWSPLPPLAPPAQALVAPAPRSH